METLPAEAPDRPRLAFVHGTPPSSLSKADTIVALTARAFEECESAGLSPTTIPDHADLPDLCFDSTLYHRWKLEWLRRLDCLVGGRGTVQSCALMLSPVVDSLVVAARRLGATIDAIRPSEVLYCGPGGTTDDVMFHQGHMQFWPLLGDRPLAQRLLPLLTGTREIAYTQVEQVEDHPPRPVAGPWQRTRRLAARVVGPYRQARSIVTPRRSSGASLLLWVSGYGARDVVRGEMAEGRRLYSLQREGTAVRMVQFHPMRPWRHSAEVSVAPTTAPQPGGDPTELLREVDGWAQLAGAGDHLRSRLMYLLAHVVPAVDRAASTLAAEMRRLEIERVVAANPFSPADFATLIGARQAGAQRLLVQHGDHLFPYDFWLVTETPNADALDLTDATLLEDLPRDAMRLGTPVPSLRVSAPRADEIRRRRRASATPPSTVAYVPSTLNGDTYIVGGGYIDDAWYYRWQRRLADAMALRRDTQFIWKALPSANQALDPIPGHLDAAGITNVVYETRPFSAVADRVGRVVVDFGSTALYESVHLGLPVLALSFPRFSPVRAAAAAVFARVLRVCESEEQALGYLDEFLRTPSQLWIVDPAPLLAADISSTSPRGVVRRSLA